MTALTFLFAAIGFGLCAMYFASRTLLPMARQFLTYASPQDALQTRVFPLLAFVALVGILAKLIVF